MTSRSDPTVCAYVGYGGNGRYRCPALAAPGSTFCPVHERRAAHDLPPPAPLPRRSPDVDVLPWQPDDVQSFTAIALRHEENRQARRAALKRLADDAEERRREPLVKA